MRVKEWGSREEGGKGGKGGRTDGESGRQGCGRRKAEGGRQ